MKGYFIVKDFKEKVVTREDLKQLSEIIRSRFKDKYQRTNVLRAICVAKKYDPILMERESLERKIGEELKANFKLDLIVEEKVGYSVLWIS
jgi:hypothetical protein